MIPINDRISLDEKEFQFEFIRASGPGGQNVNKVSTAVRLRFDVTGSVSLPEDVRQRLIRLAGKKVGADGFLTLHARAKRTQEANRREAIDRLVELVQKACERPRHAGRPGRHWPRGNGGSRPSGSTAKPRPAVVRWDHPRNKAPADRVAKPRALTTGQAPLSRRAHPHRLALVQPERLAARATQRCRHAGRQADGRAESRRPAPEATAPR